MKMHYLEYCWLGLWKFVWLNGRFLVKTVFSVSSDFVSVKIGFSVGGRYENLLDQVWWEVVGDFIGFTSGFGSHAVTKDKKCFT